MAGLGAVAVASLVATLSLGAMLTACTPPGGVARLIRDPRSRPASIALDSGPVVGRAGPEGKVWLGLPYAAPPIGPLRWRPPRAPAPWTRPRASVRLAKDCVQNLSPRSLQGRPGGLLVRGSEDCLYLNVYAPSNAEPGQHWPVMVWFHGGGFVAGTASNYDPSLLAQRRGVIVVTFDYRLGALGFFAHPALSAERDVERGQKGSGDFALLDQQAALRWVAANIAEFGGDPRRVTLFGESAGGFSICHHLASPAAVGLFSAAIIQSGSCTGPGQTVSLSEAEQAGLQTALDVGCPQTSAALGCLRALPARRLARLVSHRVGALGANGWGPVIGGGILPTPMSQAFASGRFNHVPVIVGSNRDEGRMFALLQRLSGRLWSEESYDGLAAEAFGESALLVLSRYDRRTYGSVAAAYGAAITDSVFACPTMTLARLLAPQTPTWSYEFADPRAVTTIPMVGRSSGLGAFHASEIVYLFQRPWILADPARFEASQKRLADTMGAYWASFAYRGDPNGAGAQPPWPSQERGGSPLQLSPDHIAPAVQFATAHQCAFWAKLDPHGAAESERARGR